MTHRSQDPFLLLPLLPLVALLPLVGVAACSSTPGAADEGPEVPAYQGPNPGIAPGSTPNGLGPNPQTPSPESPPNTPSNNESGVNGAGPIPNATQNGGGNAGSGNAQGGSSSAPPDTENPPNNDTDPPTAGGAASAGCGQNAGRPTTATLPNTILTFPPEYDGSTPMPVVFAFHGAGRTNVDMRDVDSRTNGSVLEDNYVMAYMKSQGNGWDIGADYPRFEAALEQLLAERCIDTSAIFAFGHSSGAQFIVQLLGDNRTRETRFAAIVPVASSRFQNPAWAPLPTLVIHGLNDNQRQGDTSGASDIIQYVQSNQCAGTTRELDVPTCGSFEGGVTVNPGCIEYVGCGAVTRFCNHDDPNYVQNGTPTNHGWPCFATSQIFQFFESVR